MPVTLAMVRQMVLSLNKVEEGTCYGTPAFRVSGALFARLHHHPAAECVQVKGLEIDDDVPGVVNACRRARGREQFVCCSGQEWLPLPQAVKL